MPVATPTLVPSPQGGGRRTLDPPLLRLPPLDLEGSRVRWGMARQYIPLSAPPWFPSPSNDISPHDPSPLHPRPRPRLRRHLDAGCAWQCGAAGAARRRAGLCARLVCRASRHALDRLVLAGSADRHRRRQHQAHPGRLGRRDAAQPCAAEGGRDLSHAQRAQSGAHRPRHRSGGRQRRPDALGTALGRRAVFRPGAGGDARLRGGEFPRRPSLPASAGGAGAG